MGGGDETKEGRTRVRTFETGATRNDDPERVDWVKMLSLPAMFEYARYMRAHRQQADGNLREYDNWKGMDGRGGIPLNEVAESLMRHTLDLVALDAGEVPMRECNTKEACCAIIFNAMAYLHTVIARERPYRVSISPETKKSFMLGGMETKKGEVCGKRQLEAQG